MRPRESREVWSKRVRRWDESDLTAREFAAELGINASTLTYWKYRLAKEARTSGSAAVRSRRSEKSPAVTSRGAGRRRVELKASPIDFVELAGTPRRERIEVRLRCGRRLLVPTSVAPAVLAELADSLEQHA